MKPTTLNMKERLILINQFSILKELSEGDCDKGSFDHKIKILREGYSEAYPSLFEGITEEIPIKVCEETIEILNMHRAVKWSLCDLSKDEIEKLDIKAIIFDGFDKNSIEKHYYYAKFMIEDGERWVEHRDLYLNSHSAESIIRYRSMMKVYERKGKKSKLSKDDLEEMIEASR